MTTMAMAGLLRNISANLVGRSPGTVEYEITPTPPGKKHDHTSREPLPGPCSNSVLNRPGPVANQESQSRGVVIKIQQRLLACCASAVPGSPLGSRPLGGLAAGALSA